MSRLLVVGLRGSEIWKVTELKVAIKATMVHLALLPFLTSLTCQLLR